MIETPNVWEQYPLNLSATLGLFDDELRFLHRRLERDADRLFSKNTTNVQITTVSANNESGGSVQELVEDSIHTADLLEDNLRRHLAIRGDHFIFISQSHTWAPLQLSEAAFRQILTIAEVHPSYLDLVHAFGDPQKGHSFASPGGTSSCIVDKLNDTRVESGSRGLELFYNFRYMARTGREGWPWSERLMGVYSKYTAETNSSLWIFIQPTPAARKLPLMASRHPDWALTMQHGLLIASSSRAWRGYLDHLDYEVGQEDDIARLDGSLDISGRGPDFVLGFSNVQKLHHRRSLTRNAISALQSNISILKHIRSLEQRVAVRKSEDIQRKPQNSFTTTIEDYIASFAMNQQLAHDIAEKAKETEALVTALLNMKHSQAIALNTESSDRLAEVSRKDTEAMLAIAKATREDSGIVRIVTMVAFVYLPGTFVATLFSTGFVTYSLSGNGKDVARQLAIQRWTYAGVTAFLTTITLLASYLWIRRTNLRISMTRSID